MQYTLIRKGEKEKKEGFFQKILKSDTNTPPEEVKEKQVIIHEEDLLSRIQAEFKRRQEEKQPFELQAMLCYEYYTGNQYVRIDQVKGAIEEVKRKKRFEHQHVRNHIQPIINTRIAKLKKSKQRTLSRPQSDSTQDIENSSITNSVLEHIERERFGDLENDFISWVELTGSAFHFPVWDPSMGEVLFETDEGPITQGDIDWRVETLFTVFPYSTGVSTVLKQRSMLLVEHMDVDELYDTYGESFTPEKELYAMGFTTSMGMGGGSMFSKNVLMTKKSLHNHVRVFKFMEIPSKKYPDGLMVICTNDKILHAGDLPFLIGTDRRRGIPLAHAKCVEIPGQFFGQTIISLLLDVQNTYNDLQNKKHLYLDRKVFGALQYEQGSIDDEILDDILLNGIEPGQLIELRKGSSPITSIDLGTYPTEFLNEEQACLNEFILLSGVSEISRNSHVPTGAGSGIALQILDEKDNTRLSLTSENIGRAKLRAMTMAIRLYQQFAQNDFSRFARITEKSHVKLVEWTAANLTSESLFIEGANILADTITQRRQMVFDLLKTGLFSDPKTGGITAVGRAKVLEMLELGNWEHYTDDEMTKLHLERAKTQLLRLLNNEPAEIYPYDNHELHVKELNKFRLSSDFDKLTPEIRESINQQVDKHIDFIAEAAKSQQAVQDQMLQEQMLQQQAMKQQPKGV